MSVLSRLRAIRPEKVLLLKNGLQVRHGGHGNRFEIFPSNLVHFQTKNFLHMYFVTPCIFFAFFVWYKNIFEGDAVLAETPSGYRPHYFEYERNPVTRWIVKNFRRDPALSHERFMFIINHQQEVVLLNRIAANVMALMRIQKDTFGYYQKYRSGKYGRIARDEHIRLQEQEGIHTISRNSFD